jgi:hypothetical protein
MFRNRIFRNSIIWLSGWWAMYFIVRIENEWGVLICSLIFAYICYTEE